MKTYPFRFCIVREFAQRRYLETCFADGAKVGASPQDDIEQHATAIRLGYRDDVYRMIREHELLHTAISELRGLPYSPTLYAVAHPDHAENATVVEQHEEEALVLAMQLYLNTGAVLREVLDLSAETGLTIEKIEERVRKVLNA